MGRGAGHARRRRLSSGRRVLVIGGGLAGITAALDCAAAGASVTLVEVRRRLGGAAYSFERDGLEIDNGQHVFLRCCVAYRALLRRLGSEHLVRVQPRLEIPVLKPGAAPFVLRRSSLPAPLHLAAALARYPHLTLAQRLSAGRAALALMRLTRSPRGAQALQRDRVTFAAWLARHGQGGEAVDALWDLIALPTLNLPAEQASLALSAFVFANGLFAGADAGDIGFHAATLSETIGEPARRALEQAGVEVRLGWRAEALERDSAGFRLHARAPRAAGARREPQDSPAGGASVHADAAVVAVPHTRAAAILEPLLGAAARRFAALESSPIVNLHVVYDREVLARPFAAGVGTPVQYLFDRTAAAGAPAGCQYLAVSLSGAEREMQMSVPALRERFIPALRELLPRAREANVESFLVTREHAATFRPTPGVAALRPATHTALDGLLLAGAWTATGWPATLEGAVLERPRGRSRRARRAADRSGVSDLLLAAPLRVEALLISSAARRAVVRKTGMGPARAKAAAGGLVGHGAKAMLVLGFGGGLDDSSIPGEVIVAEDVYAASDEGHAEARISCELTHELVATLTGRGMKVRTGDVVCVSKLALGERRAELHAGGAIAVDMESVWLAGGAGGRPFGVVRVVLDSPSHELMRPQALAGALRAARALRRVAAALNEFSPPQGRG